MKVFAPAADRRTLALGLADGTVRLWDTTTRRERLSRAATAKTQPGQETGVSAVAFSADGTHLVVGGRNWAVRVLELPSGREVRAMQGHRSWVEAVAVTADGKRIASSGQDGQIRLWDAATGATVCPPHGHDCWVFGVTVSPDGKATATASADGTLRVWEAVTGRETGRIDLGGWPSAPPAFMPDGKAVAAIAGDGRRLRLWDAATGAPGSLTGALADRPCQRFCFAAGGKVLVTAYEGAVSVWDWLAGRLAHAPALLPGSGKPGQAVGIARRASTAAASPAACPGRRSP